MTITKPFIIKNGSFKVGAVEYGTLVAKARLVPDQTVQTQRMLVPAGNIQDVDEPIWTLKVTFGADWTPTTGLADILNTAAVAGTTLTVVMAPKLLGPNATCTIAPRAVDFGGDVGAFNMVDAEFPVVGQPTFGTDS